LSSIDWLDNREAMPARHAVLPRGFQKCQNPAICRLIGKNITATLDYAMLDK